MASTFKCTTCFTGLRTIQYLYNHWQDYEWSGTSAQWGTLVDYLQNHDSKSLWFAPLLSMNGYCEKDGSSDTEDGAETCDELFEFRPGGKAFIPKTSFSFVRLLVQTPGSGKSVETTVTYAIVRSFKGEVFRSHLKQYLTEKWKECEALLKIEFEAKHSEPFESTPLEIEELPIPIFVLSPRSCCSLYLFVLFNPSCLFHRCVTSVFGANAVGGFLVHHLWQLSKEEEVCMGRLIFEISKGGTRQCTKTQALAVLKEWRQWVEDCIQGERQHIPMRVLCEQRRLPYFNGLEVLRRSMKC